MDFHGNTLIKALTALLVALAVAGCEANGGIGAGGGAGGGGNGGGGGGGGGVGENCPSPDLEECPTGNMGAGVRPITGGATASGEVGPGCPGCSVEMPENVLSGNEEQLAVISTTLAVLPVGGLSNAGVLVELNSTLNPGSSNPGFSVSFPAPGTLLSAGALPDLTVTTLLDGTEVSSTIYPFGLLSGTLGEGIALAVAGVFVPNDAIVFLGTETSEPYNQLRIDLSGIAANALIDINVHQAYLDGVNGSIDGDFPL